MGAPCSQRLRSGFPSRSTGVWHWPHLATPSTRYFPRATFASPLPSPPAPADFLLCPRAGLSAAEISPTVRIAAAEKIANRNARLCWSCLPKGMEIFRNTDDPSLVTGTSIQFNPGTTFCAWGGDFEPTAFPVLLLDRRVRLVRLLGDLPWGGQLRTIPPTAQRLHQRHRVGHLLHLKSIQSLLVR